MNHLLTDEQRLLDEQAELRTSITAKLRDSQDPSLNLLANQLAEAPAESYLEKLGAKAIPDLEDDMQRFRQIDASLCLLQIGMYGICSDCEEPIEHDRIMKDAATQRCEKCQQQYDKRPRQHRFWL